MLSTPARAQFYESEREALVALYHATDGDSWTRNDNWLTEAGIDHWYGVQVIGTNRRHVYALNLPDNNLRGEIPREFLQAASLEYLDLSNNAVSGWLPYDFPRLRQLRSLKLSNNPELSGTLSPDLRWGPRDLMLFWFDGTALCESGETAFQNWMSSIDDVRSTGCVALPEAALISTCEPSLSEAYLDGNNVRARIPNNGELFYSGQSGEYRVPTFGSANAIFAASIWVAGLIEGQLHAAATRYGPNEFWAGPLDDAARPPGDCSVFDRMYKVEKREIETYEATSVAAWDLANWPTGLGAPTLDVGGHRIDVSGLSYAARLARKIDLNAGERPELVGDQAIWWIMNDRGNVHNSTDLPSLGVEVHGFAYAANSGAEALNNSTLYRYTLVNRNSKPIEKAYFALFVDVDLGDAADDYVGSDTLRNIGFVYNADNFDERRGLGYGEAPPAVGIRVLRGPLADEDGIDNNRDGRVDELGERPGMSHFVSLGSGGPPSDPTSGLDYYYVMQSIWKNGDPILYGGDGFESQVTSQPANYMFPGNPVTGEYWSERNRDGSGSENSPADRRFVLSSGPFNLAPSQSKEIDFAIIYGRGQDHLDSVTEMRHASDGVQAAFESGFTAYPPGITRNDVVELRSPGAGASNQPTSLSFHWSEIPGSGDYQIRLASDHFTRYVSTEALSVTISDLDPNELYQWSVKRYTPSGTTPWAPARYFTTGQDSTDDAVPIPAAPANGERLKPGNIHFYWNRRPEEDHRVQISEQSDFSEVILDFWKALPGFSLYLKGDQRYFWRVLSETGLWSNTSSFIVSDGEEGAAFESDFSLHDNFPNPFSDRTTFSYFLPYPSQVRLEVFDMLGRKVSVPVDGGQAEGQHYILFEAENLTSGMYIYTFTVNDRTETGKMVVAR